MGFSLGIGLTNDCNLNCAHCYRDTETIHNLTLAQVKQLCEAIPIDAIGMGTGENALNPEFLAIVDYLRDLGIQLSIASNGYSLTSIPEWALKAFHDVEVSIDFPTAEEQDAFRGQGNWSLVHQAIERCHTLGIEVSILCTLMKVNFERMDRMIALARLNQANLRVNAYQAVKSDRYRLSYTEFWEGYRRLFADGLVVACSEPVVRAKMGFGPASSPCGRRSIRVNPRGQVLPCVYWPVHPSEEITLQDVVAVREQVINEAIFQHARQEPTSAVDCPCRGGCASRRALHGQMDAHDDYCPWVRGDSFELKWQPAPEKDLIRIGNVCTTVVI